MPKQANDTPVTSGMYNPSEHGFCMTCIYKMHQVDLG